MKQSKIGITGSIASGKSILSAYLGGWNLPVIDADLIARELVEPGSVYLEKIAETFGDDVLEYGALNREKLAEVVFSDAAKRKALNAILHPPIYRAMLDLSKNLYGPVFYDIPLLIENLDEMRENGLVFDEIWLLDTDPEVQKKRLMQRDNIDEEYALRKIAAQMPSEEKKQYATRIFDNSKDLLHLYHQVDTALEALGIESA